MIRPISVASDGYLSVTKRVLIIAVAGYLNFGGTTTVVGGSIQSKTEEDITGSSHRFKEEGSQEEEILMIIESFLACQ